MRVCKVCQEPLEGRSDRKYCSSQCKNRYHQQMRSANTDVVKTIDQFLHRNRIILYELLKEEGVDKLMVTKTKLQKKGFRFSNFTGLHVNSRGKTYHHVYDYSWMEFTSNEIMIIKR